MVPPFASVREEQEKAVWMAMEDLGKQERQSHTIACGRFSVAHITAHGLMDCASFICTKRRQRTRNTDWVSNGSRYPNPNVITASNGGEIASDIRKALEKGYLEHLGLHAVMTTCLRISSVLDGVSAACCLLPLFVKGQLPCLHTNSRNVARCRFGTGLPQSNGPSSNYSIQFGTDNGARFSVVLPRHEGGCVWGEGGGVADLTSQSNSEASTAHK